jgi:hypothetical protein
VHSADIACCADEARRPRPVSHAGSAARRSLPGVSRTHGRGTSWTLLAVSAPYCPRHTDLASVPTALEPKVAAAFGIPTEAARLAVVRCDGATLLACSIGANLNCGKADMRRSLPGASAYCRENPASDFVPMFATGRDTIYGWRCAGGRAVAGKPVLTWIRGDMPPRTGRRYDDPRTLPPVTLAAAVTTTAARGGAPHGRQAPRSCRRHDGSPLENASSINRQYRLSTRWTAEHGRRHYRPRPLSMQP